jgi:hypothetical protein
VGWREPVRVSLRIPEVVAVPFLFTTTVMVSSTAVARGELSR